MAHGITVHGILLLEFAENYSLTPINKQNYYCIFIKPLYKQCYLHALKFKHVI